MAIFRPVFRGGSTLFGRVGGVDRDRGVNVGKSTRLPLP
jgi:hypothetical protein